METASTNDEHTPFISKEVMPTKPRSKDRHRSQAPVSPASTDINDPENLDYEEEDAKVDDKQRNDSLSNLDENTKSSMNIQDEDGEVSNHLQEIDTRSVPVVQQSAPASDEGEVDEADLEDGEIHDPSTSKTKGSLSDDPLLEQQRNRSNPSVSSSPQAKVICRFFLQGRCHWGPNCKYIHPNHDSIKNANGVPLDPSLTISNDMSPPSSAGIPPTPLTAANAWIPPQATAAASQFFPNPILRGQPPPAPGMPLLASTGTESAWERGLRSAKTLREQSMRRKQQDKDFNEKKYNLTIRDAVDDRETDENLLNIDRPSLMDYDLNGAPPPPPTYADQRGYSDRYPPYMYPNASVHSHYNNPHRMNNHVRHPTNALPVNDRRPRHPDDYPAARNDARHRNDKLPSTKNTKSSSKRDEPSSFKRNSSQQQYTSGSHHNNDEQLPPNAYGSRRGDDWHDPWDRSRNHGGGPRRSSGVGREPSYSSSSGSSSSTSRSRHQSSSSSSRSRSRSRSRPKRRSPSVTRATKPPSTNKSSEATKNGSEKKSNGNKKLVSPSTATASAATTSTATNKFLPGRQISSHTLKKAEKSSHHSHTMANNHAKDPRGKDVEGKTKKQRKKDTTGRSASTSSSSSSDTDTNRVTHRSSSSSSGSSSSENETRTSSAIKTKTGSSGGKTSTGGTNHSSKTTSRQLSSSSGGAGKSTDTKPKNGSSARATSKSKESSSASAKKRRDTSSSTGSTSTTKKTKLNADSHQSSTDLSNAENSDSSKKKEKQKLLKKLEEVEKLISQRSTKASS